MTTESQFWEELRSRINLTDIFASAGYCDWIEPDRYYLGSLGAHVRGRISFVAPDVHEYDFCFSPPETAESLSEINWALLLPEQVTHDWARIENGIVLMGIAHC
jgi:hypothetical protein